MKTSTIICLAVVLSLGAVPAMADLYTVDFVAGATVKSHAGISLSEWGEYESGGGAPGRGEGYYGGIGTGNSRMVLGHSTSGDSTAYAEITYPDKISAVTVLSHLDGIVDDSYSVTVDGADWGSYTDVGGVETWMSDSYSGTPGYTLRLTITNVDQGWADVWGQLAIDRVEAVPVPGAVLLGILGLGAAGLKLRKFA